MLTQWPVLTVSEQSHQIGIELKQNFFTIVENFDKCNMNYTNLFTGKGELLAQCTENAIQTFQFNRLKLKIHTVILLIHLKTFNKGYIVYCPTSTEHSSKAKDVSVTYHLCKHPRDWSLEIQKAQTSHYLKYQSLGTVFWSEEPHFYWKQESLYYQHT